MRTVPIAILIVLTIIELFYVAAMHGEDKGKYNISVNLVGTMIEWSLIMWAFVW